MSKQENWVQIDKKLPKGITQTKKASDIETIDQVVGCYKKKWEVLQLDVSRIDSGPVIMKLLFKKYWHHSSISADHQGPGIFH